MSRPWFYTMPAPIAYQSLSLIADDDRKRYERQLVILRAAEDGDESAKQTLREMGLRKWVRNGIAII